MATQTSTMQHNNSANKAQYITSIVIYCKTEQRRIMGHDMAGQVNKDKRSDPKHANTDPPFLDAIIKFIMILLKKKLNSVA
jgi:hypothetical protein